MFGSLIHLAEKGLIPDPLILIGIRSLCKKRLHWANKLGSELVEAHHQKWVEILANSPIALVPEKANEQHYEVPPQFFEKVLGDKLKYSSGYWKEGTTSLDQSEIDMLDLTIKRSDIKDGMNILELGCGWGSLTCYMGNLFPKASITAVSNSHDQKIYIDSKCKKLGLNNIQVITSDMNIFNTNESFDRVISIEMFEHMRNYHKLLNRISKSLKSNGKLFIHIFSHQTLVYPFVDQGPSDWMAREFFSGGLMPSHRLLLHFQNDLKINNIWRLSGKHYSKTSWAWLSKMDKNKKEILEIFSQTYGPENASIWWHRWRIFFMSCAELFGMNKGNEWGVSHYLFVK